MGIIQLRNINEHDTDNIVKWRNSLSVKKFLFNQDFITREMHQKHLEDVKNGTCVQFIIELKESQKCTSIGTVFIKNIDLRNKNGEIGIFIGEESLRGKGYGISAIILMLNYGFVTLQLHRIFLNVMIDNTIAIKTYEKCGFVKEGILRDYCLRSDCYVDVLTMSILSDEWEKQHELMHLYRANTNILM